MDDDSLLDRSRVPSVLAGINSYIKEEFLNLPEGKLDDLFSLYRERNGENLTIYAREMYPRWKYKTAEMSGEVPEELLRLTPSVFDTETRFAIVNAIRKNLQLKQFEKVTCNSSNWFIKVSPVVNRLVARGTKFRIPQEVLDKLDWLMDGDALFAQRLHAAAEVEEAATLTSYLANEYALISGMLANLNGSTSFRHDIELPQGTISVTITRPKGAWLQRLRLTSDGKRALSIICRNPYCEAELETTLRVYAGEPIVSAPGDITCPVCGATYSYGEPDLSRRRSDLNVELEKTWSGSYTVHYDCPSCGTRLWSPYDEAGNFETCPKCHETFLVPGADGA